jgi:hypothetical protein
VQDRQHDRRWISDQRCHQVGTQIAELDVHVEPAQRVEHSPPGVQGHLPLGGQPSSEHEYAAKL